MPISFCSWMAMAATGRITFRAIVGPLLEGRADFVHGTGSKGPERPARYRCRKSSPAISQGC